MSDYKLVPVERLKDWHKRINTIAVETAFDVADEMGAMLEAAAPDVQGEPVAEEVTLFECVSCNHLYQGQVTQCDCMPEEQKFNRWLARPQPTEQQPDDSAAVRLDKQCRQDVAAALGFPSGGNYAWSYLLQQVKDAVSVAEQKPDVALLVEALEEGLRAIGDHHAPDDCYATGPMTGDHFRDLVQCPACSFIAMCDDLLADHRKGGCK